MNEEGFWRIVDECRQAAGPDTERAAQLILRRLRALSEQEILDYEEQWFRAQDAVFTWPVRDAASLLLGGVDDDDFMSVQEWIVSHGRAVLERVKADPDRLVELMTDRHNARTPEEPAGAATSEGRRPQRWAGLPQLSGAGCQSW